MGRSFEAVAYGIDDITLGFDLSGSRAIPHLNGLRGSETRRGKMLGRKTSFGKWSHPLGRSVAFWKKDTKRLYVQAKLAPEGALCPPDELGRQTERARGSTSPGGEARDERE